MQMNAIPQAQITHESETQRQYPRFSLPSRVVLNGKEYSLKNLSAGGAALQGVNDGLAKGKQVSVELRLPFSAFSLGIALKAEVQYYDAIEKVLGCRFVEQGPEQVSFLNHAIKSFLAGEIVSADNILSIAQRNNFTKVRPAANNNAAPSLRRQLPGLLLVLAVGVLVTALILGNLYNSLFIVRADDAAVAAPAFTVRAAGDGVFNSKLDPGLTLVDQGQVIGTITPVNGGAAVTVQSPCHCYIAKTNVMSGDLAQQGQEILSLVPVEAQPWVVAEMGPQQAKKIGQDSTATITIFGAREPVTGHIVSMESALSGTRAGGDKALLKIVPDQKLPVDFVNRLAAVTFDIR
jgi:alginate biosynthesis protein Alg44